MARFETALAFVFEREGGFSDDPDDRGGTTKYGITQATYDEWRKLQNKPTERVAALTRDTAAVVYYSLFWLRGRCDRLPVPVDALHFDACVNHGVLNAGRMLQQALSMAAADVDGVVGPKTIGTALAANPILTFGRYMRQRMALWLVLAGSNPKQMKFLTGWLHRAGFCLTKLLVA